METQYIRVHTPYITARMMWAVDGITEKRKPRWRATGSNNYELSLQCTDETRRLVQQKLDELAATARQLELERMQRKYPSDTSQSTGTEPDANSFVLPYVNKIDEWLDRGLMGDKVMRDVDVAGTDAHYFWTIHCPDRPGTQLFVCVSWHGADLDPAVVITVDVRYTEDQEPIAALGALSMITVGPTIAARTVLLAVQSFHAHGHI